MLRYRSPATRVLPCVCACMCACLCCLCARKHTHRERDARARVAYKDAVSTIRLVEMRIRLQIDKELSVAAIRDVPVSNCRSASCIGYKRVLARLVALKVCRRFCL